jgi:hypothetical protein
MAACKRRRAATLVRKLVPSLTAVCLMTVTATAAAEEPKKPETTGAKAKEEEPKPGTRPLQPLEVDVRMTAHSTVLLTFVGVGAGADIGLVKAGPGTLAAGAALDYDFCASACWFLNTVTPLEFSQNQISTWGRLSYHLDIKGGGMTRIDVYPMIMAGPTFARASVKLDDGSAEYRGRDTAISVGAGIGANVFLTQAFFIGGEGRYRYSRGTYDWEIVAGNKKLDEGSVQTWSLSGIEVMLAAGFRF